MNLCKLFLPLQLSLSWSPPNLWPFAGEAANLGIFLNLPPMSFVWVSFYRTFWIASHTIHVLYASCGFVNLPHILTMSFSTEELLKNFLQISVCNSGHCPVSWILLSPLRALSNVFSFFLRKWTRSTAVCEEGENVFLWNSSIILSLFLNFFPNNSYRLLGWWVDWLLLNNGLIFFMVHNHMLL